MYLIRKEDLQIVIDNCFPDDYIFDLEEFNDLLEEYGEEWFIIDGQFRCVNKNEPMEKLKEKVGMK